MLKTFTVIFILLASSNLHAEIYKWTDKNGKVRFGDQPPKNQQVQTITPKVNSIAEPGDHYSQGKEPATAKRKTVIMYSTSWCGYCRKARNYFKQNNIPFKEYDIEKSKSAKKRYDALGGNGIPLIVVGKKKVQGFSVKRFQSIYPSS